MAIIKDFYLNLKKCLDAQAKAEKAAQMQTAFGGFLAGKTALGASSAEKALNKKYKFDGEAMSVAEFVERHANDETLALSTSEVNKYKGASRSAWNRMSEAEQKADEERVKNSGTKTVYMVNGYDLGKTAYEYAQHLIKKGERRKQEGEKSLAGVVEGKIYKNNLAGGNAVAVVRGKSDGKVLVAYASDVEDAQNGLFMGEQVVSDSDMAQMLERGEFAELKQGATEQSVNERIVQAESVTNVAPTDGQKEAGNYKKGHVRVAGYDISIEQPKGSVRSGVDANGNKWEQTMHNTYGYFRGTEGVDGDHIDVFLANDMDAWNGEQVFVVDQYNEDGSFDEHKVMLGFDSIEDAQSAYLSNYEDGWADKHRIVVTGTNAADFKKWVDSSHRKTKAFADYKNVKKNEGQSGTDNSGRDDVAANGTKEDRASLRSNLADFKEGDVVRDYYDKQLYRIKKHSKNGVSTIALLDEDGNEVGTKQMNAHNNSRYSLAEPSVKAETPTISQESEQVGDKDGRDGVAADGTKAQGKAKVEDVGVQEYEGGVAKAGKRSDNAATKGTAQSTWDNLSPQERLEHAENNPLTAEEIENLTADEVNKANAIAYLNGTQNLITQISYLKVYEDVRIRPTSAPSDNGVGNRPQLAEADSNASTERGRGGESRTSPLRTGKEGGTDRERVSDGGAHSEGESDLLSGESGDNSVRGSQSSVDGVSSRGANSGRGGTTRSKRSDGGRDGRSSSHRNAEVAGKQSSSIDEELNAALGDFKAVLSEFTRAGRETLSISIAGLNNKQLEILPKLISAGTKVGYAFIKKGVTQLNAWAKEMKTLIGNHLSDAGLTDVEVDAFIEELWNSHFPIGEEVHTIGEWASILGMEKTRSAIKTTLKDKKALQDAAEGIRVKIGDATNIAETLPFLLPQQQDDVLKAETQFFDESHNDREHAFGKGYMFTNGTGTGKTYTGLGIVKRFIKQGKGRILIVTPSQQKVTDWIGDAKNLNISLRSLDDFAKEQGTTATQTSGEGAVITTFANFRENAALLEGVFDLVVYDESHRILENKQGTETAGARQHYMVTNRDANSAFMRLREINSKYKAYREAQDEYNSVREAEVEKAGSSKNIPGVYNPLTEEYKRNYPKLYKAKENLLSAEESWGKEEILLKEQAEKDAKVTKVVFLSATPFNTRDNLDYAERYIFTYPEEDPNTVGSYKHQSPRTRFYLEYFGGSYKFRYGRLEKAGQDSDVISRQEIAFSDYLQNTLQTMSGRVIDSEYDYSRDFPTVSLAMGDRINDAISSITEDESLRPLWSARHKVWYDYNYSNALFETMKISAMAPRLKQHLDAGRKVVIFHRRVETKHPLTPPFALMLSVAEKEMHASQNAEEKKALKEAILKFRAKNADLLEWEKTLNYSMPREQLGQMFGNDKVLFFSGKESAKVKNDAVSKFNDDNSGKNIIVIQEASGKEGISLHDRTGKHQRVVITLALPQSPITALQIEGRIYRIGNKSNAIFEYPILGLDSEMVLFGQNFNKSVSTTENLALGSQARNLRNSFARGIEERSGDIPIEEQGVGGKESDASKITEQTPYDNAILDYYTNQKITARRDQREGVDYYPTPEPLGFMMNEWGGVKEGDELLEPSAGHGAIARYAPTENKLTAIEPSGKLFSRLQIKVGGASGRNFVNDIFENYNIVNKHDVILMNPPFGVAGKLAAEHVEKAFKHLTEGGRIVAIVPEGKAQDRIGKWLDSQKDAVVVGEVLLPDVTFKQAGTNIKCRVVVIDKITNERKRLDAAARKVTHNLGYVETIEEFFNELQNVSMPDRTIDTQLIMQKRAKRYVGDLKDIKGVKEVVVNQDSVNVRTKGWRNFFIDWSNYSGNALKDYLARQYKDFANKIVFADENSREIMLECQSIICKLANMTEDEMDRYISNLGKGDTLYRISDSAEEFAATQREVVEKNGIVTPGLKEAHVEIVDVERHNFSGTGNEAIQKAKEWANNNIVGEHTAKANTADEFAYTIDEKSIKKYLSSVATGKSDNLGVHLSVLKRLPDVINKSIEAEIHADYKKTDGRSTANGVEDKDLLIHRFYGCVRLNNELHRVKITLKERKSEGVKPYSYEVTKIELLSGSSQNGTSLSDALNNSIPAAKLLENVEKSYDNGVKLLDASEDLTNEDTLFSYKPFGGNRGYVGYSMSKRAAQAREEGRFPKTDFKKEYGVTEKVLDALVKAGIVDNAEWHHTSMYGNRTPFYGWVDDAYAEIYAANKEAVKNIAMGKDASGKTLAAMPAENPYTEMAVRIPEGWYPFVNSLDDSLTEEERDAALMERFGDAYAQMKEASENNRLYHEFEANRGRMERAQREEIGERLRAFFEERAATGLGGEVATASQLTGQDGEKVMGQDGETATGLRDERGELRGERGADAVQRMGDGVPSDDAVSDANDLIGKALGKRRYGAKQRVAYAERVRRSMVRVAGRLAKDLHLDNVDIVTDVNELPEGKKRGAKGFYSKSTGRITIVVPNHVSTYDIEQTVLHEAVAHYGLRKLFGAHFDTFLDNVFENAEGDVRRSILELAKKNGWDFRTATEEYLASLAEDTDFENAASSVHGWWVKLKRLYIKNNFDKIA